jgi:hypothetical protein
MGKEYQKGYRDGYRDGREDRKSKPRSRLTVHDHYGNLVGSEMVEVLGNQWNFSGSAKVKTTAGSEARYAVLHWGGTLHLIEFRNPRWYTPGDTLLVDFNGEVS